MAERNMCNVAMRDIVVLPGSKALRPHHVQKDRIGTWEVGPRPCGHVRNYPCVGRRAPEERLSHTLISAHPTEPPTS
jgi:hypothetical protein